MQEMTSPTEEEKKRFKDYFEGKISFNKKESEAMMEKFKTFTSDKLVDAKTFSALASVTFTEMYELFYMLKGTYEGLIELDNDITTKTNRLEKLLQEIGGQSGANMAKIVEEIDGLKKTLKEPMYQRLDQFITNLKEEARKREKAGESYVD